LIHCEAARGIARVTGWRLRFFPQSKPDTMEWSPVHPVPLVHCAPRCTMACVHQISYMDFWRGKQDLQPNAVGNQQSQNLVQLQ
jgi:hypothetical protein